VNIVIRARGLADLRKALKGFDPELRKELRQVWLRAARHVASKADAAAPGRAKGVIKPRATQRAAFVAVRPKRGDELAVFMGQRQRSGWYGFRRYRQSPARQFRPWVGSQWDPGETGGKPYFIGDAINDATEEVVDMVADGVDAVARRAGFT